MGILHPYGSLNARYGDDTATVIFLELRLVFSLLGDLEEDVMVLVVLGCGFRS